MAENDEGTTEEPPKGNENDLGDAGKRALDAERKARSTAEKRLKELEAKVKEAEDADKSEAERLQGQVADLMKQAEAATAKADRFEVAAAKGLNLSQARRLVGSTKDELEADAEEMRQELGLKDDGKKDGDKDGEPGTKPRPREDLKPGDGNEDDAPVDAKAVADLALGSSF